jgi:hypothetical protein
MKKLFAVLFVGFAFVLTGRLSKVAAQEEAAGVIPISALRGNYADLLKGSFAVCPTPVTFAEESCKTAGALVFPLSIVTAGHLTVGKNVACETGTEVVSDLPVDISPAQTTPIHVAPNLLDYDSKIGTGDFSFTAYTGGTCKGATFDSTGATVLSSGTVHFVASNNGKRVDGVVTSLTDPAGGIGDFSLSTLDLRQ